MQLSRRSLFGALGAGAGALIQPGILRAASPPLVLRAPLLGKPEHRRLFGGFRPFRFGGFRLDICAVPEEPGQYWINNYGHGGGGITLSWGCAEQVVEWVDKLPKPSAGPFKIVILGAGVIGLTTAKLLVDRFGSTCSVEIYADKLTGRRSSAKGVVDLGTTSDNAGGQFEPSFTAFRTKASSDAAQRVSASFGYFYSDDEIVRLSYNHFTADAAVNHYAVSMLPNYMTVRSDGRQAEPPGNNNLVKTREALIGSSVRVAAVSGYAFDQAGPVSDVYIASSALPDARRGIPCNYMIPTLLIEVPKMMDWLRTMLKSRMNPDHFTARGEVLTRFADANVIVNCLGCDGGLIAGGTNDIHPKLGVVLALPSLFKSGSTSSAGTHYLYGGLGYIFTRADCTIVGGWKKDFDWSDYRGHDLLQTVRFVGQTLDYYMYNFVNGRRSKANVLECFTNDDLNTDSFAVSMDSDKFLEMDGNHICLDNPLADAR